ncbi:MAG TPA: adenylate/guanylate cyclase domain-containing protein [Gaiellaceae bacterium]
MTCPSCGAENRAEARFCDSCGATLVAAGRPREQRKTVTVLFCDVTGSTALGERLDPEALRTVMSRYFDAARAAIERHGGTVEKFIGDAVMAVFGVPTIREDDALRAVRAAQQLRETVDIDVRIGVNTGEVVTGDADKLVTGDAVNVAARLEQAAAPGEVLVGATTYELVRDAVAVDLLPPLEAKGKSEPVTAYRLVRVTGDVAVARRLDVPLVGRERERRLLVDAWERAVSECAPALFTILGAAGVGKSRLAGEFLAGLEARIVRGRCLSYGDGITYWPVVEVVMQLLGEAPPPDAAVAALLGDGTASADDIAFSVRKLLERAAAERPLVVVLDDIQWGEPTFLDLVEHVADWSRDAAIFLLCLARPDLLDRRPGWGGGKLNATAVLLEPLTASETDELIDALLDGRDLDDALRARIRTAADGNPLFVEQMLAMLDESSEVLSVPPTIQALLAARLDQLPDAERAALERGAVEGQVFHRSAVAALAPTDADVSTHLGGLVRKELVRPSAATLPDDDAFRFRHLLIRDAAYDALPKAERAELHERFGAFVEERAPDLVELDEIVGYHLEQAALYRRELGLAADDVSARAAERLGAAGRRAESRDDVDAAVSLLARATALLPDDAPERLALLVPLARVLYDAGRLDETVAAFEQALGSSDEDVAATAFFLLKYVEGHTGGDLAKLQREVESKLAALETPADETLAFACFASAWLLFWNGRVSEMREMAQRALDHGRACGSLKVQRAALKLMGTGHFHGPSTWGEVVAFADEQLAGMGPGSPLAEHDVIWLLALAAAWRGSFDEGLELYERQRTLLLERGLTFTAAATDMNRGVIQMMAGRPERAEEVFRRGWDELTRVGEQGFRGTMGAVLAWSLAVLGRYDEARAILDEVASITSADDWVTVGAAGWARAEIASREGRHDDAVAAMRDAVELVAAHEYLDMQTEFWFAYGEILVRAGRTEDAPGAFRECLRLADLKESVHYQRTARARLDELTGRT